MIAAVTPQYLADQFRQVAANPHDVILLLRSDGAYLARSARMEDFIGKRVPSSLSHFSPTRSLIPVLTAPPWILTTSRAPMAGNASTACRWCCRWGWTCKMPCTPSGWPSTMLSGAA
ncbi:hypothetical protein [Paludibacterium denitrificans]|uniref:hypothetical protein n=1 Tax=Paludibacterium denitrificans TaxID=2675226 RepID=UPI001E57D00C|nr:hypothetical protein [Paludibacterium denitrificans]